MNAIPGGWSLSDETSIPYHDDSGYVLPPKVSFDQFQRSFETFDRGWLTEMGLETEEEFRLEGESSFMVRKQQLPCCVCCAFAGALEILYGDSLPSFEFSEMFVYFFARGCEVASDPSHICEIPPKDVTVSEALNAIWASGIATREQYPSLAVLSDAFVTPSPEALNEARSFGIGPSMFNQFIPDFWSVRSDRRVEKWITYLALEKRPVLLAFQIPESYPSSLSSDNAILESSDSLENVGHMVIIVGYDLSREVFVIKDSMGTEFADSGYWYLPFSECQKPFIMGSWIIGSIKP